jgi:ketosteroid isomerase-like protein
MVSVRDALAAGDVDAFAEVLAPDVVWVGVLPGQLCRNREQVVYMLERARDAARRARPEVLAEGENVLLIDPHLDPPAELNPKLHQVLVLHDGLVSEMRDYPNRKAALAAFEAL